MSCLLASCTTSYVSLWLCQLATLVAFDISLFNFVVSANIGPMLWLGGDKSELCSF